jgi:hypothetical protein
VAWSSQTPAAAASAKSTLFSGPETETTADLEQRWRDVEATIAKISRKRRWVG